MRSASGLPLTNDVAAYERARDLLGVRPTQGKCEPCGRFLYFRGRLADRACPTCGRAVARTSGQSQLPRFVVIDGTRPPTLEEVRL